MFRFVALVSVMTSGPVFSVGVAGHPHMTIAVSVDGGISVDGKPSTLKQLDGSLAELKRRHGDIWYTRDRGNGELSPGQLTVFEHIVRSGLPIRLYTDRTFKTEAP